MIRVEYLSQTSDTTVTAARSKRREQPKEQEQAATAAGKLAMTADTHAQHSRAQQKPATPRASPCPGGRTSRRCGRPTCQPPTITASKGTSTALSSHEVPFSYYPKPLQAATMSDSDKPPGIPIMPQTHRQQPDPLSDGRQLRRGQPDRLPNTGQGQPDPPTRATPLAAMLWDGGQIPKKQDDRPPTSMPPTNTAYSTTVPESTTRDEETLHATPENDTQVLMQTSSSLPPQAATTAALREERTAATQVQTQSSASTVRSSGNAPSSSGEPANRLRSWEHVEKSEQGK